MAKSQQNNGLPDSGNKPTAVCVTGSRQTVYLATTGTEVYIDFLLNVASAVCLSM